MSQFKTISHNDVDGLEIARFKEMDYYAVEEYDLPIELMMENAGLQLATLINFLVEKSAIIQIGVGNGNNGGGGLVAARRLAAWGYNVSLDIPLGITKKLPKSQLNRALKFGAKLAIIDAPEVWVDAYLGFSQRLPLPASYQHRIEQANKSNALKISLDIPTGFLGNSDDVYFKANHVLSLAAAKKILIKLPSEATIYLADLGLPKVVYDKFGVTFPPFNNSTILKIES